MSNSNGGFDLSKILQQAQEVAEKSSSSGGGDLPRVVYPGPGEIKVKILFNPKSGVVTRQTRRHTISEVKTTCLGMYSKDCPVCIAINTVENALGTELSWKVKSSFRGISYAQFVDSSPQYDWGEKGKPGVGDLVVLMYSWSVYEGINEAIASAGANANKLIADNDSKIFSIKRTQSNNRVKYTVSVDPFATYQSFESDKEFNDYLNNLPDLCTVIEPREPSEEMMVKSSEVARTLEMQYLNQRVGNNQMSPMNPSMNHQPQYGSQLQQGSNVGQSNHQSQLQVNQGQQHQQNFQQQQQPQYNNQPSNLNQGQVDQQNFQQNQQTHVQQGNGQNVVASGKPECFGNHQDGSYDCLSCLSEHECTLISQ